MTGEPALAVRVATAARSNAITFVLLGGLSVATTVVVAHALGASEFAVYALALAARGGVAFLADLGTGAASQRVLAQLEAAGDGAAARRLFGRLLVLRLVVAAVLVGGAIAFSGPLGRAVGLQPSEYDLVPVMAVAAAGELVATLGTYALWALLRQPALNRIATAQAVLQPVLVLGAVATGLGTAGVVAALAIVSVLRAGWVTLTAAHGLAALDTRAAGGLPRGAFGRTAGAAGLGKLATFVHSRPALSIPVLAATTRPVFAVFALAYDLTVQLLAAVNAPTSGIVAPYFAKVATDEERTRRVAGTAIRLSLLTAVPAALALVAGGRALGSLIYGDAFASIARYLAILAPALAVELAVAGPCSSVLLARNDTLKAYAQVRALTLAAVVLYPVVGFGDVVAVACVLAAARVLSALALLREAQRALGPLVATRWWLSFGVAVAAGVVVILAVQAATGVDAVRLFLGPAAVLAAFAAVAWKLRLVGPAELGVLRQLRAGATRTRTRSKAA